MIWLILSLGITLRLISLNQSLRLDEAINVMAAKSYSFYGMITQYAVADFHPPGWFIILWNFGKIFGYSEIVVRLPAVIFGVVTLYFTYLIGKKLISKNLGLLSALLLSVNPLHIYYSQDARMYALATMAVSINIFLLIKLIKGEKLNPILLILSNIGVLSADYISYFIFPAQFALILILKRGEIFKKWLTALLLAVALGIWWVPVFLNQLDVGAVASANLPTWKFVVGGFDFKALPLTFVKFIIGRISLADKFIYGLILLPICSLFAVLLLRAIRASDNLSKKLLLMWIAIPIFLGIITSLFIPVYSYFRLLPVLPGFLVLTSFGILSFKGKLRYLFLIMVILIQLVSSLIYLTNPVFQREDWRGVVKFLTNKRAMILFESSGTLPPFDYYAGNTLNAKGALKNFPANSEDEIVDLADLLKDYQEVYLVDYLVQISDPQRLVAKKLGDLDYKQTDIQNFNGVGFIYHYVKNE